MIVSMTPEEIAKLINDTFGDKIASCDAGDVRLNYEAVIDGKNTYLDDWVFCTDEAYFFIWYALKYTYSDYEEYVELRFRNMPQVSIPTPNDVEYCINKNDKLDLHADKTYDDDDNDFWEFDKESLIQSILALRDYLKPNAVLSQVQFEEDLVV